MNHLIWRVLILSVLAFTTMVSFQNCGSQIRSARTISSAGGLSKTCAQALDDHFAENIHAFVLDNRCNDCHFRGGTGKSSFADPDPMIAMDGFLGMGDTAADKLARRAVSDHQSGYTGPHLKATIEQAKKDWADAVNIYNGCSGDRIENNERLYVTSAKPIGLIKANGDPVAEDEFQFIEWDLGAEQFTDGQATGAKFSIGVQFTREFKGTPVYIFTFPTLITGNQTIIILGINVLINGEKHGRTTFDFQGVHLLPNSTNQLSNMGLDLQPSNGEFLKESDVVQIEFDYFEIR